MYKHIEHSYIITISYFFCTIANVIEPSGILFANRENEELIIYIKSLSHVEELVKTNLSINRKHISINYLVLHKRKIVLVNVDPIVSNSVLLPYLQKIW